MTSSRDAENSDEDGAAKQRLSWRAALIRHASRLRGDVLDGKSPAQRRLYDDQNVYGVLGLALGPMAQEAVKIVEAYTIGAVCSEMRPDTSEKRSGDDCDANVPPPEFNARLNIILNGLEPDSSNVPDTIASTASPKVIQSDLWQLLYKVRESAELAYAREIALVELDRRMLFLLSNVGPLAPADISSAVGVDKAQVSRSVKRLIELKMVEREQLRAPLRLTRKGAAQSARLLRLAELRNRELTFDIGDEELSAFFAVIEKLLDQAVLLYEEERTLNLAPDTVQYPRPGVAVESESRSGDKIVLDRSRIISPLMTLSSYFSRSGSLTFKRLTELSNFEAWVLNEIGMNPPIAWGNLVERLDRDHSQAGRTINSLLERDLITRKGGPGRRHGQFAPSEKGQALYEIIQDASRKRSAFLLAPLSQAERDGFLETFDKIRRNAVVQLERERTFEEMGQG